MSVRIEGINSLSEKVKALSNMDNVARAVGKACAVVEAAAIDKAPKGSTGNLKRSIQSKVDTDGGDIVGTVFTDCDYAAFVCYGTGLFAEKGGRTDVPWRYKDDNGKWHKTSGQSPQPFLRPAFDESRERVMQILKEGIGSD